MANKDQLRGQRENTVINQRSKREDKQCQKVVESVIPLLEEEFHVKLRWEKKIYLVNIIKRLKELYPQVSFAEPRNSSFMSPDGGITYLLDHNGNEYPILIAEV